jgi:hypothetical protein
MGNTSTATKEVVKEDYRHEILAAAQEATGETIDPGLASRVELNMRVGRLRKKVNALAVVYSKYMADNEEMREVGRTEVVRDTLSHSSFVKSVVLDYSFEQQQRIRIEVYHVKNPPKAGGEKNINLGEAEFVGSSECYLAEVVASTSSLFERPLENILKKKKEQGLLWLVGEELASLKYTVSFTMRGKNLLRMNFFSGTADPFCTISRQAGDGTAAVYRSEVKKRIRNPTFDHVQLPVQALCRGDPERPIIFELFDWELTRASQPMGTGTTTYAEIKKAAENDGRLEIPLWVTNGTKKTAAGKLCLDDLKVDRSYSFLDYVNGGLEVALLVAVDFTLSNGDPRLPTSLHNMDTTKPNDYVMAMRSVGEILQYYDADKKYPVYGFGAKLPPSHVVSSPCFALNGDYFDPEVDGIDGIIEAYRNTLEVIQLHGPTSFSSIVKLASDFAKPHATGEDMKYFILLLITDGVINDMEKTINEIVRASRMPISIIIVGVGDEDFSMMDKLDADEEPLWSTAEKCYMARDIVQFVQFSDYKDKSYMELAMATLDEVPREVVNFFQTRNIQPGASKMQQLVDKLAAQEARTLERKHTGASTPGTALADPNDPANLLAGAGEEEEDEDDEEMPQFLQDQRRLLVTKCQQKGWSEHACNDAISRGIWCPDVDHMLETLEAIRSGIAQPGRHVHANSDSRCVALNEYHSVREGAAGAWGTSRTGKSTAEVAKGEPGSPGARSQQGDNLPGAVADDDEKSAVVSKKKKERKKEDPNYDDDGICKICLEAPIDTVILECGHQVICEACSAFVGSVCPLCRQTISRVIRTFNS